MTPRAAFLALLIVCGFGRVAAEGIVWHKDLASGQQAARASGKSLLVYVYQHSQAACVEMDRSTFPEALVIDALQRFEPVALNAGSASAAAFCEAYKLRVRTPKENEERIESTACPAYLFLNPEGQEYYRTYGFYPPLPFVGMLQHAEELIALRNALATKPKDARLQADLGHLYLDLERPDLGKPLLEEAVKLDPRNETGARADAELDLLIISIPDTPELAARQLTAYLFNNPETKRSFEIRYFMAVAYVAAEKPAQAEKILLDFAAIPPHLDAAGKIENPDYKNHYTVLADLLLKQLRELQATPEKK